MNNELKKNISFISEINITKFEWLRVKSTLNDAAKRVPFHYNPNKSWWWATACTGKLFCCWINMVCRTMKGWGSFKRICSASVVQVQFFYGTRKMFCLSYSGRRVNNSLVPVTYVTPMRHGCLTLYSRVLSTTKIVTRCLYMKNPPPPPGPSIWSVGDCTRI